MKKFQILVDSASDLYSDYLANEKDILFNVVPLTITVGEENFVDDDNIDVDKMMDNLHKFKGKTSSACPSPQNYADHYKNAENTFVVTISQKLSGSYNSAVVAKQEFDNDDNHNIHVIDSKLVSGAQELIVDKLVELIHEDLSFDEIVSKIEKFRDERELFFTLSKFDNLIANGRMNKFTALIAKTLIIKPICKGENGEIKVVEKCIGSTKAFKRLAELITNAYNKIKSKVLIINKCKADEECNTLLNLIKQTCKFEKIKIKETKGLCSYYALEKGLIICF